MRPSPLLALALLFALLPVAAPPAAATHACSSPGSLAHNSYVTGTVGSPAVGWPSSQWYAHGGSGTETYVLVVGARADVLPHAQISYAAAWLRIWDASCTVLLCQVHASNADPAYCTFGGPARIEVLYDWSHEFHTDYTLTVVT